MQRTVRHAQFLGVGSHLALQVTFCSGQLGQFAVMFCFADTSKFRGLRCQLVSALPSYFRCRVAVTSRSKFAITSTMRAQRLLRTAEECFSCDPSSRSSSFEWLDNVSSTSTTDFVHSTQSSLHVQITVYDSQTMQVGYGRVNIKTNETRFVLPQNLQIARTAVVFLL